MQEKQKRMPCIKAKYQGKILLVSEQVAKMINIKDGHEIKTEAEFWAIIKQNSEYNIAFLKAMLNNKN